MTIFDKISNTRQRIERIEEKIIVLEMQATTPKSGEITGMPRGGGSPINPLDQYLERKERFEKQLKEAVRLLELQWKRADLEMNKAGVDEQTQKMMYYRFYKGMSWRKCAAKLNNLYPECKWNENKCFRKYREVLSKTRQFA